MSVEGGHQGGCQCGAVRYRIQGDLPLAYACHCGECKKQSASAFSLSIAIPFARMEVQGDPAMFEVTGYSGATKRCYFCPFCGTRLWHRSAANPDGATLKVGTLDDPQGMAPAFHLWVSRKMPGFTLDPDVPVYETQPDDLNEIRRLMAGKGSA